MRAVVIGGSGQIGSWLLRLLSERGHNGIGTYCTVAYPGLTPLDAADKEAASRWIAEHRPDVVFYPAGFTWVDGCERDPEKARDANVEQPLNVAQAAKAVGSRFVYFSTDYVFDGSNGPNTEDDPPCPPNVYGLAKREAEVALTEELGDGVLILRTSWVYGPERQGKNFAYQVCRRLVGGQDVTVPSDQCSNPSYGPDVARTALDLVERGTSGLLHVVGPEVIDRVAFAKAVAEGFGLGTDRISGKPTAELSQGAPRPLSGGLTWTELEGLLPGAVRPVSVAIAAFAELCRGPQADQFAAPLEVPASS